MKTTSIKTYKPHTPGITGSTLKIIALICMLIDHTGVAIVSLLPQISDSDSAIYALYWIMRLIGRCAFPIYCFLLIEGLQHTKNNKKYVLRMLMFSLISEVPFDLALFGKLMDLKHQNVFWTLAFGLLMLIGFSVINKKGTAPIPDIAVKICGIIIPTVYFSYRSVVYIHKYTKIAINDWILYIIAGAICLYILVNVISRCAQKMGNDKALALCAKLVLLACTMMVCDVLHTDYNSAGILAIAVMYLYRANPFNSTIYGCVVLTALSNPIEMTAFVTAPLVQKYNGQRGLKLKYVFYAFYPVHLIILYVIALIIGLRILQPLVL